jgi:hypothetical protein
MTRDMIGDLLATVRTGTNELVRQNAYDLLLKLAADGAPGARGAIEAIERTQREIRNANSQDGHRPDKR